MPSRFASVSMGLIALLPVAGHPAAWAQDRASRGGGSWAFSYPSHPASERALLDLRDLNEREAGQSGFVRLSADGNDFVLGDGTPARFWAVGSSVYTQPPEAVAKHVRFLAKMGVNMVRLHTQVAPNQPNAPITGANHEEIDHIWRFVAEAKKQGIYVTISPYWANAKEAGGWKIPGYPGKTDLWGLLFFDETLQAGYKAWVRALYAPKNPYTGIPLAADPAVAIIQVQNEDSLLFWTMMGLKPEQEERLAKKYGDWLARRYGSLDEVKGRWKNHQAAGDDPSRGRMGLLKMWELLQDAEPGKSARIADQLAFFGETQRRFYEEITAYYRNDLGCKPLINASNWRTADQVRLDDIERWTYAAADVIAVNKYYNGGVHLGPNSGWRLDPGDHFTQVSALKNPRDLPTNLKQVVGHPMLITESTWVAPLGYQSEGPFLTAVYESLTGIDAFYWFDATSAEYDLNPYFPFQKVEGQSPLLKWGASNPAIVGGFPAAALLFRKGYVKRGEPVVHEERALESLWGREFPMIAEANSFDPNRDRGFRGGTTMQAGVDPMAFLVGPVEVKYDGNPKKSRAVDLTRFIDPAKKTVKSITGEVALDYGRGLCTLDAPKAQGASGSLADAGTIALGAVAIKSKNAYATVMAVAMDDQPLGSSKRILVQVGTLARPTGWKTKDAEFPGEDKKPIKGLEIVNTGRPPWQVADTEVQITVKNPKLTRATLLDPAGFAARKVTGTRSTAGFAVTLPPETMYLILE